MTLSLESSDTWEVANTFVKKLLKPMACEECWHKLMSSGKQQLDKDGENNKWCCITLLDIICPWLKV